MNPSGHPGRMLFVNFPVADLERSKVAALGFSFNPNFAAEKFAALAKLPVADPATHTLALYCFSVSSREEVDAVAPAHSFVRRLRGDLRCRLIARESNDVTPILPYQSRCDIYRTWEFG